MKESMEQSSNLNSYTDLQNKIESAWPSWNEINPSDEEENRQIEEDLKANAIPFGAMLYEKIESSEGEERGRAVKTFAHFLSMIGMDKAIEVQNALNISGEDLKALQE